MILEKNIFDFLSLIIQLLIAVGTISAVIISLWQSKITLREMCKINIQVGTKTEYNGEVYFKEISKYDNKFKNYIVVITINNTGIRKFYINILYIYDILSKKTFILKVENNICLDSGEYRKFESDIFFDSNFIQTYKSIYFARYRLYFIVETRFGTQFRKRLPQYFIDIIKKNSSSLD